MLNLLRKHISRKKFQNTFDKTKEEKTNISELIISE